MRHFFTALLACLSFGASAGVETSTDHNDVILAGHDAVAYFTQNKAVVGNSQYTAQHEGAVYRFASEENRDLFRSSPNKYAPAYGGFCAFGTTFGKKFDVDGKAFQIVEGRLYVNKNLAVYETWRKEIPQNIVKAEGAWPGIRDVAAGDL
jgi:YHS domain-containing protein